MDDLIDFRIVEDEMVAYYKEGIVNKNGPARPRVDDLEFIIRKGKERVIPHVSTPIPRTPPLFP